MDPEQVFDAALLKYGQISIHPNISIYKSALHDLLNGSFKVNLGKINGLSTDPLEDFDDFALWMYGLPLIPGLTYVLVSNGKHDCQLRLEYIKARQSYYKNVEWNIPFITEHGTLIFLKDGSKFPKSLDVFINAGPMSATTIQSIHMNKVSLVVTVGAKEDGTAAGINQTATDGGQDTWNEWIKTVPTVKNLGVDISRYILFPKLEYVDDMLDTARMFIACRPPPECLRINEGNSIFACQVMPIFERNEDFKSGLASLQEYIDLTIQKGLPTCHYEAAAVPIVLTNLFGGRYAKGGPFGFNPADMDAKHRVGCLIPETVPIFTDRIRQMDYFTPAYDPVALIMAVHEYNLIV